MYPDEFDNPDLAEQEPYQPPRRVRQRLPATAYDSDDEDYDEDELSRPRWTTKRVLLVVITLMIVISLLLLDFMPLLTQFWQSFPSNFFQRPDPTFIPGA